MKIFFHKLLNVLIRMFTRSSRGIGIGISDRSKRFILAVKASELCGGVELFSFGDRTSEMFHNEKLMSVNMKVDDSSPSDWTDFFQKDAEGLWIYLRMKNVQNIVIAVGWNSLIRRKLSGLERDMSRLYELFPNSYCLEIPMPNESVRKHMTSSDCALLLQDIKNFNESVRRIWKGKTIIKKDITLTFEGRQV